VLVKRKVVCNRPMFVSRHDLSLENLSAARMDESGYSWALFSYNDACSLVTPLEHERQHQYAWHGDHPSPEPETALDVVFQTGP
jgi:hypothetical protein